MSPANSSTKLHDIGIKPKFGIFSWELSVNNNRKKYDQVKCETFRKEDNKYIVFQNFTFKNILYSLQLYFNFNPAHKVISLD